MSESNVSEAIETAVTPSPRPSESPAPASDDLRDVGSSPLELRSVGSAHEATLAQLERFVSDERALWIEVPGPDVKPRNLVEIEPTADAFVWEEPGAMAWAGLGAARQIEARGTGRFEECRERGGELLGRLGRESLDGQSLLAPRLFGGFAFFAGGATEPPWEPFGDAHFVLPRIAVCRSGDDGARARWVVVLDGSQARRHETLAQLVDVFTRCEAVAARGPVVAPLRAVANPESLVADSTVPRAWRSQVESAVAAIERGQLAKVVLSRREHFELGENGELVGQSDAGLEGGFGSSALLLQRLADLAPESLRFLVRLGGREFLGATPERLVRLDGLELASVALAGSLRRSPGSDASHLERVLLGSRKDRLEHEVVVQFLVERLADHCADLRFGETPGIRHLSHIVHLETPFRGRLKTREHVLDLVDLLHPTPAVGGRPVAEALRLIEALEEQQRGWYSGPVGWFDAAGSGDFHVALRSFLLDRDSAYAYAGGGIVADSDVSAEYAETLDKLALVESVLGVRERAPALSV